MQFNLAKRFGLKLITVIFLNIKFDVSQARTWKGMGVLVTKFLLIPKNKNFDLRVSNALLDFFSKFHI